MFLRSLARPAAKRVGEYNVRIETKMGVGLRYRRPKVWSGSAALLNGGTKTNYSEDDVKKWRADFGLPKRTSSTGVFFPDSDLMEWRYQFDALSGHKDSMSFAQFSAMVRDKVGDTVEAAQLPTMVMTVWAKFDADRSNTIDYGEFIKAGQLFDVHYLKDRLRAEGVEDVFQRYQEDGFLSEAALFQIMTDYKFTVATSTQAKQIMATADRDGDGMLGLGDWKSFAEADSSF